MNEVARKSEFRWNLVLIHWLDLLLLSVTAFVICMLFDSQIQPLIKLYEKSIDSWGLSGQIVVIILTPMFFCFLVCLMYKRLGGSFQPRRHFLLHPPLYLLGMVIFVLYTLVRPLLLDGNLEINLSLFQSVLFVCVVFILFVILFCVIHHKLNTTFNAKKTEGETSDLCTINAITKSTSLEWMSFEWMKKWLLNDKPTNVDFFDMKIFSERIGELLKKTPLQTIGLQGPYGCGKSSILKQVEKSLNDKNIVISLVKGWGFREGTIVEHILQQAVNDLSKHLDCISIANVPKEYSKAMNDSGVGLLKVLSNLLPFRQRPLDVLNRIDQILARTNKRLVFFLEDLDRNTREDSFFNEIAALLNNIKEIENISFVLAIGSDTNKEDVLIKLCEHIEVVPELPKKHVKKLLSIFQDHCHQMLENQQMIDPLQKVNIEDDLKNDRDVSWDITANVTGLLRNPRLLKRVLRRVLHAWGSLCGEISFQDLFVANVIRETEPEVYFFINDNIAVFQKEKPGIKWLNEEIEKLIGKESPNKAIIINLCLCLFPDINEDVAQTYAHRYYGIQGYQFVDQVHETDYWVRLNREGFLKREIRDQEVFKAIQFWNEKPFDKYEINGQSLTLVEAITYAEIDANEIYWKLKQFKELISKKTLKKVVEKAWLIDLAKTDYVRESGEIASAELMSAFKNSKFKENEDKDWLVDQVICGLKVDLLRTEGFYNAWDVSDYGIREEIAAKMIRIFSNDTDLFLRVINPLVKGDFEFFETIFVERMAENNVDYLDELVEMKKIIIKLGEQEPNLIVPWLAVNMTDGERKRGLKLIDGFWGGIDESDFDLGYDPYYKKLMNLLSNGNVSVDDGKVQQKINYARKYAKKWLEKNT